MILKKNGCLLLCMYSLQGLIDGSVSSHALPSHLASFFVHCSSFSQTLILLHTSVRLHQYGEDGAALGSFFSSLSSKTDLMIQFQLCNTSNSTIWNQFIIKPGSLLSDSLTKRTNTGYFCGKSWVASNGFSQLWVLPAVELFLFVNSVISRRPWPVTPKLRKETSPLWQEPDKHILDFEA